MKEGDMEKIGLVDFIRSCVEMSVLLLGNNSVSLLPSIPAASNQEEIRKDQGNHLIIKTNKKGVCKYSQNQTSYIRLGVMLDCNRTALKCITVELNHCY